MLDNRHELIAALNSSLVSQRYSQVVVRNYCTYASGFLDDLEQRGIPVSNVTDVQVEQYLRHAIALFKKRRGRRPSARWHEVPRSGSQHKKFLTPRMQMASEAAAGRIANDGSGASFFRANAKQHTAVNPCGGAWDPVQLTGVNQSCLVQISIQLHSL
jgi:hypothetical protein